jgi:hypothetical protein
MGPAHGPHPARAQERPGAARRARLGPPADAARARGGGAAHLGGPRHLAGAARREELPHRPGALGHPGRLHRAQRAARRSLGSAAAHRRRAGEPQPLRPHGPADAGAARRAGDRRAGKRAVAAEPEAGGDAAGLVAVHAGGGRAHHLRAGAALQPARPGRSQPDALGRLRVRGVLGGRLPRRRHRPLPRLRRDRPALPHRRRAAAHRRLRPALVHAQGAPGSGGGAAGLRGAGGRHLPRHALGHLQAVRRAARRAAAAAGGGAAAARPAGRAGAGAPHRRDGRAQAAPGGAPGGGKPPAEVLLPVPPAQGTLDLPGRGD